MTGWNMPPGVEPYMIPGNGPEDDERPIVTSHEFPPIPDRRWDWSAVRDGYEPGEPIGRGATEAAAIADLLEQEQEREE